MLSMTPATAHLAVYDTYAGWEFSHPLAELHTGRYTGGPWQIVTVAESPTPITTMAGLRVQPDTVLSELDPVASDLLVLPGAELWDTGGGTEFAAAAARFLDAGVPVVATCGATAGLASEQTLEAYEGVFHRADPAAFPALMQASA